MTPASGYSRWFDLLPRYMFACCLHQVLENRLYLRLYNILQVCVCVCWEHDKHQYWVKGASFIRGLRHPSALVFLISLVPSLGTVLLLLPVMFQSNLVLAVCWELYQPDKGKGEEVGPGSGRHCLTQHSAGLSCLKRSVENRGER